MVAAAVFLLGLVPAVGAACARPARTYPARFVDGLSLMFLHLCQPLWNVIHYWEMRLDVRVCVCV